jgi:hypothetical protein
VFNMNSNQKTVSINSSKISDNYTDFDTGEKIQVKNKFDLVMKPWSYKLLFTKK